MKHAYVVIYRNRLGEIVRRELRVNFLAWMRGTGDVESILAVISKPCK